jgi:hypothetical protein
MSLETTEEKGKGKNLVRCMVGISLQVEKGKDPKQTFSKKIGEAL